MFIRTNTEIIFQVNRDIVETMVDRNNKYFVGLKPVFDGRSNMYTRDPLPIPGDRLELEVTLPGEGKDRVFRVSIKWVSKVIFFSNLCCICVDTLNV